MDHCYTPFKDWYRSFHCPAFGKAFRRNWNRKNDFQGHLQMEERGWEGLERDPDAYKAGSYDLLKFIRDAKITKRDKMDYNHYSSDSRFMWSGLHSIRYYKGKNEAIVQLTAAPPFLTTWTLFSLLTDQTEPWMMPLPWWHSVKMLFIDYSSAFNTIIPSELISMLVDFRLETSICS